MTDHLLRAIGVFYAFGGVLVLIRIEQARAQENVYAALTGGPQLRHTVRTALLTIGGMLTCVGGVALAGLSDRTLALMGVNTFVQLAWLGYAAAYFPPEDDEDRKGRSRTANAAVVYALAFGLLIWLTHVGRMTLARTFTMDLMVALLLGVLGAWQAWSIWRHRRRFAGPPAPLAPKRTSEPAAAPFTRPAHVELRPYPGAWPLWDSDSGANLDPGRLELPPELIARVQAYENAVLAALDQDPERGLVFRDARLKLELERQATTLAGELEQHLGRDSVAWRMPDEVD